MTEPTAAPARQRGTQPDVNIEHAKTVEVHESPAQLEVHEHIEVEEPVRVVRARDIDVEKHDERDVRRDRVWRSYTVARRDRRFGTAALALGILTVATAAWLMSGALRGETAMAAFSADEAVALMALAVAVGLLLVAGAAEGIALSLFLAWLAGLGALVLAVHQALREPMSGTGQVLTALLAVAGLLALVATTVGLASWRGQRAQERIYRDERRGRAA